jgi:GT2 family glycosyltransferase/2-polyprenyl-3-methyl-5-hydroxy-6-metoxy-1,4-benzoquinol methylase
MTEAIDLSIVIVSHGHEPMLPACLASLQPALADLTVEIVVIDNLQEKGVAAALAPFSGSILENHTPMGFAANINRGARATSGRHLLILNPDTVFRAGRLAEAIAFLDSRPDVGILGCTLLNPDGTRQQNFRQFPTVPVLVARGFGADRWSWRPAFYRQGLMEQTHFDEPHPVDWVFGAFMLMRRADFERLGGMDEGFRLYYEDVDLCYRFRRAGLRTYVFPQVKFVHTHARTSASQPFGQSWRWHVKSAVSYFWKSGYCFSPRVTDDRPRQARQRRDQRECMDQKAKIDRESRFWDARTAAANERDPELYRASADLRYDRSVPWLPQLGFPLLMDCVLERIGDVRGKRVLDLGTGSGFLATLLAANGAQVDAVDVSEASLAVARWRAEISGVADRIRFHCRPAEALGFDDAQFDAVCGVFVLHHLDLSAAAPELRRVLRPGGTGAFIETSARSRVLSAARRLLPGHFGIEKASSDDEAPLGVAATAILEQVFGRSVRLEYPTMVFFRMASYISPLHLAWPQRVLAHMDALLYRVPALRAQSYFCVVSFRRD